MIAGRSWCSCQGTTPPALISSRRRRNRRPLMLAGSFATSIEATTLSLTSFAVAVLIFAPVPSGRILSAGQFPAHAFPPMAMPPVRTATNAIAHSDAPLKQDFMIMAPLFLGRAVLGRGFRERELRRLRRSWKMPASYCFDGLWLSENAHRDVGFGSIVPFDVDQDEGDQSRPREPGTHVAASATHAAALKVRFG